MDALSSLHRDGLTVTRLGVESLRVSPSARLTDQHRSLIKELKTNILAALGRQATSAEDNLQVLGYEVSYIRDAAQAVQAIDALLNDPAPILGLDIETGGLDPLTDRIRCIQVATANWAYVFDLQSIPPETFSGLFVSGKGFIAHNAVFEYRFLHRCGLAARHLDCSMLMCRVLQGLETRGGYPSLASSAESLLHLTLDKTEQKANWMATEFLSTSQVAYAALDAALAYQLGTRLPALLETSGQYRAYRRMAAALPVVADAILRGVPFDRAAHQTLMREWQEKLALAKAELHETLPELNPDSPKQLAAWLEAHLPGDIKAGWERTPTGALKTGAEHWAGWSGGPNALLDYKRYQKLLSTYGDQFARHIHPSTGRIHAEFNIAGTRSGRFACHKPNLQNPPRSADFRSLFRPDDPNYRLVVADYSQIELRIAALIADDRVMLEAFRTGTDLHRLTASLIAGVPLDKVTAETRSKAKAIAFGILYGMGAAGLQKYAAASFGVTMGVDEAVQARNAFFDSYRGIKRWRDKRAEIGRYDRTVTTVGGLVRDMSREPNGWSLQQALNTPIQGSAAEVLLEALARLPKALEGLDAHFIHHVHDEIILEVHVRDVEAAKRALTQAMVEAFESQFPASGMGDYLVEAHDGPDWEAAKNG
jgi:DNA polymerase-1